MCNGSTTSERFFKVAFLAGRLCILAAIPVFLSGLTMHSEARMGGAILMLIVGIISIWIGRVGLFWLK